MPFTVAFDTSVLREVKLSSGPITAVTRYAKDGILCIHLPFVVVREYETLRTRHQVARRDIKEALRKLKRELSAHDVIDTFDKAIELAFREVETRAATELASWMSEGRVRVIAVGPHHAEAVLEKYFNGHLPFKQVKNRDDFPDAFVVESMLDLASEPHPIFIVAKDTHVVSALRTDLRFEVLSTVAELTASERFKAAVEEEDHRLETIRTTEREGAQRVADAVAADRHLFKSSLEEDLTDEINGTFVSREQGEDESEDLYVESSAVVELDVESENATYLGEGVISIPFVATLRVTFDVSTGNPFLDDLYGSTTESHVEVTGTFSVALHDKSELVSRSDWSGVLVLQSAFVSLDSIESPVLTAEM